MLGKIFNKTSVVGAKAHKCSHHFISVPRVWLQAVARHHMAEEHYMVPGQMRILGLA